MGLRALGDSAWLFEAGGTDPHSRLDLILKLVTVLENNRIPELRDIVSSFDSLAVHFDPADGPRVLKWLTSLPAPNADSLPASPRTLEIPVSYGGKHGPDLKTVAAHLRRSEQDIISLHSSAEYTVAAIGFSPGFPYLSGLPQELRLPRLATPRPVPAGSVAIAGTQAGVYPSPSQAGWHILGRTNLTLFTPHQPAVLRPGDHVRFVPTDQLPHPADPPQEPHPFGDIEVIEPGALTTVQDPGRPGFQSLGVSPGGAADPISAIVANRLLGNSDTAAVLECCISGPLLKFHHPTRVAWTGGPDARSGKPHTIPAGGTLDLRGRMAALRGYIAIAGGIDTPLIMGSRATDLRAAFGGHHGRPLKSGDRLPIGTYLTAPPRPGDWRVGWPHQATPHTITLRFLKGIQSSWFSRETKDLLRYSTYQISPVSDRMAARLHGPPLHLPEPRELISQPVVAGSIQVPPDGQPIILMAERQTIGGYPQIGHVISADLPKLARAWPGAKIYFREVTLDQARDAWRELQRELALLQTGLAFLP